MIMKLLLVCAVAVVTGVPLHDDITPTRGESCGYDSCKDYDPNVLNVHIVPHTHDDVGWLKTVDQYYYGSQNTIQKAGVQYILDSVVKELWEDPKRRFVYIETAFFWKWWTKQPDSVRHKVHTLVRQGRLQFEGGAWSMNDEAATHYQSTIDQFTWGLSKLNATFGECGRPHVGWQIDPFGHSRELASLLAAMGYDGLFLGRLDYQDKSNRLGKKTMEMLWRGDDDLGKSSDIFTGALYNTYSPPPGFCFDVLCSDEPIIDDPTSPIYNVDERVSKFIDICRNMSTAYKTNNILITMGEDFHYQDAAMWFHNLDQLIIHSNMKSAQEGLNVKLFYSTPSCYLKAVQEANPTLPTKQDDFFPYASDPNAYWTGYFTSRPTTKYFEREANSYLQMVKQLQVLANLEKHNQFVIDELKSAMGVMQHHDAITGTEKQHVTHDYERLLNQAVDDALIVARQALNKYLQGDPLKPPLLSFERCRFNESSCYTSEHSEQFIIAVYNHLAWEVSEVIRIPVMEGSYEVYDPNGDKITSQLVDIPAAVQSIPTRKSRATHEIFFIAKLDPVSYKTFYIRKTNRNKRSAYDSKNLNAYANINEYWNDIKQTVVIDIKNRHEAKQEKPVFIPLYESISNNMNVPKEDAQLFDASILDDDIDRTKEIDQLVQIIQEHKKRKPNQVQLKAIVDDDMGMLGDDPMVVNSYPEENELPNKAFSWAHSLPKGVHLLTVEPWREKSLLLRLENYLEIGDQENTTVEVNLDAIFKDLTVKRASETMLAANLWVDEKRKWSWNKENGFSVNFNEAYGEFNNVEKSNDEDEDIHDDGLLIRLKAKQIKTYVVDFDYN
ncbi:LOW QUALITY PROTEIN: lysosomal alpha-mannosidase-like [Hyposmocoma kahamanoa]|uniref:LOW QUALITY PROTEIN: lysosomal alpha-mannosidase-like n=1 Tax=Hyposmocoma kahamanoa TaxID=1477025 RepID=UPI000E6D8D07|nr:LOW QUALITY PROTEIN: lysosomal alpha-mannosidase-like [Hyposmocoma kahamanoa]